MNTPDYSVETKNLFASFAKDTKGRFHHEKPAFDRRDCYARDRDRILHSRAFRRLQGKTQVFIATDMDHHRSRLTHTLEVAQIARSIAHALRVDESLAEAIAIAHDLGHPPFGHTGEDALNAQLDEEGYFNHNLHSFRIIIDLEVQYPSFNGLNLTWECLEGIIKHNGPLKETDPFTQQFLKHYHKLYPVKLQTFASLEAQIASIADDVAYNNHDIDDGFRAKILSTKTLRQVDWIAYHIRTVERDYTNLSAALLVSETLRRMLSCTINDIVTATKKAIIHLAPTHADDIRTAQRPTVCMSPSTDQQMQEIKVFLRKNVYNSAMVKRQQRLCHTIIKRLFYAYEKNIDLIPKKACILNNSKDNQRDSTISDRQKIVDYIAGMTDRYARKAYENLQNQM